MPFLISLPKPLIVTETEYLPAWRREDIRTLASGLGRWRESDRSDVDLTECGANQQKYNACSPQH
jgi:hypothetical protein